MPRKDEVDNIMLFLYNAFKVTMRVNVFLELDGIKQLDGISIRRNKH